MSSALITSGGDYKPKTFWARPEGTLGMVALGVGGLAAVFALNSWLPAINSFLALWPFYVFLLILALGSIKVESEEFEWSFVALVFGTIFIVGCYTDEIKALNAEGGLISFLSKIAGWYVVGALGTMLLYWLYIVSQVKNYIEDEKRPPRYDSYIEFLDNATYSAVKTETYEIVRINAALHRFMHRFADYAAKTKFSESNPDIGKDTTVDYLYGALKEHVNEYFPPRSVHYKQLLRAAALAWPCTLISLIFKRLLSSVVETFLRVFRGVLDLVSSFVAGSIKS